MIRITVELIPGGKFSGEPEKVIGTISLYNKGPMEGQPSEQVCNYGYTYSATEENGEVKSRAGIIVGHRRSEGWETLLARILGQIQGLTIGR